jgi:hypothetical protein
MLMSNIEGSTPWFANKNIYWIFSCAFFGWFYRIMFVKNTQRIQFDLNKLIIR